MGNKRFWGMAALFLFLSLPASASNVSLLLVETGISEDVMVPQYSSLWEGGLLAAFFDAGHIVTNIPIARMPAKPSVDFSDSIEDSFYEAAGGGADYFILGFLEFKIQGERAVPQGITLKVYKTSSTTPIYEYNFPAGTGKSLDEEYRLAQNTGRAVISHL